MKKNKRHLYKRLPKYALGTMKPIDLGYQPGRGIGSARFETELNMSLDPETLAIRRSYIPNAIGKVTQYSPYVTEAVKNWAPSTNTATQQIGAVKPTGASRVSTMSSQPAINTTSSVVPQMNIPGSTGNAVSSTAGSLTSRIANIASPYINASALSQIASNAGTAASSTASSLGGSLSNALQSTLTNGAKSASEALLASAPSAATLNSEVVAANLGQKALENTASSGASTGSGVLGVAGKVSAGLGAAIGAYNMFNDITGFGDHRSAPDMLANVGRSHVTTEYGNQYTTYNGVNAGQELAYEKANARSKQLGFGMNALGTGASIGSLILPGWGTAIGAAAGLLLGGLGSLFGWGDNSEEIERITRLTNDNIAMYNRQGESVARSKDVAAEFNDRLSVGSAAEGKNAYGPMNAKKGDNINTPKVLFDVNSENNMRVGIPTSKLMPGETVFDKESLNWAVVPGKGNKDNVYSSVRPGDSNVVLTKKEGLSKMGAAVLKSNAPENLKRWLLNELEKKQAALLESENNQNNMRNYKCGKLPGYWKGTDYLMSAIPHLAALGSSWNLYNRAKYADMPDYPTIVDSDANTEALNILGRRRFNPELILNMLNDQHRHALYELHRTPGLTAGGLAIAMANQNIKTSRAKAEALAQADEINNRYTADYANALANYGKWMSDMMTNNNYARAAFKQQLNAAKEGWMAQYEKNGLTALADLASDIMGVRQFNRSEDYGDKMLGLYDKQVKNDSENTAALIEQQAEANRLRRMELAHQAAKEAAEKTHPMFLNWGAFAPNSINNLYGMLNSSLATPSVKRYSWMR